jgi:hypothetical protein
LLDTSHPTDLTTTLNTLLGTTPARRVVAAVSALCLVAAPAFAQTSPPTAAAAKAAQKAASTPSNDKASHWGIIFSATPEWHLPKNITDTLAGDGGSMAVVGSQFTIGIVHGRAMGGDWGVTFVHQPVKNGSRGSDTDSECGFANGPLPNGCFNTGGGAVTQNVVMDGVQVHKFIPFATIKRRVQLGLDIAGGVGKLSGTLVKTSSDVTNVVVNQKTGAKTGILTTTVTTENVKDEVLGTVPLGRITAVGAFIVTRAIKVRWEGGVIIPGAGVASIGVTYLFGAH